MDEAQSPQLAVLRSHPVSLLMVALMLSFSLQFFDVLHVFPLNTLNEGDWFEWGNEHEHR
jgi:hypothetical protein